MLGNVLVVQVESVCIGLATGKKVSFDPRPLIKALDLSQQAKIKQQRNIKSFLNSSKYKTLMKQLQKEFDLALMR